MYLPFKLVTINISLSTRLLISCTVILILSLKSSAEFPEEFLSPVLITSEDSSARSPLHEFLTTTQAPQNLHQQLAPHRLLKRSAKQGRTGKIVYKPVNGPPIVLSGRPGGSAKGNLRMIWTNQIVGVGSGADPEGGGVSIAPTTSVKENHSDELDGSDEEASLVSCFEHLIGDIYEINYAANGLATQSRMQKTVNEPLQQLNETTKTLVKRLDHMINMIKSHGIKHGPVHGLENMTKLLTDLVETGREAMATKNKSADATVNFVHDTLEKGIEVLNEFETALYGKFSNRSCLLVAVGENLKNAKFSIKMLIKLLKRDKNMGIIIETVQSVYKLALKLGHTVEPHHKVSPEKANATLAGLTTLITAVESARFAASKFIRVPPDIKAVIEEFVGSAHGAIQTALQSWEPESGQSGDDAKDYVALCEYYKSIDIPVIAKWKAKNRDVKLKNIKLLKPQTKPTFINVTSTAKSDAIKMAFTFSTLGNRVTSKCQRVSYKKGSNRSTISMVIKFKTQANHSASKDCANCYRNSSLGTGASQIMSNTVSKFLEISGSGSSSLEVASPRRRKRFIDVSSITNQKQEQDPDELSVDMRDVVVITLREKDSITKSSQTTRPPVAETTTQSGPKGTTAKKKSKSRNTVGIFEARIRKKIGAGATAEIKGALTEGQLTVTLQIETKHAQPSFSCSTKGKPLPPTITIMVISVKTSGNSTKKPKTTTEKVQITDLAETTTGRALTTHIPEWRIANNGDEFKNCSCIVTILIKKAMCVMKQLLQITTQWIDKMTGSVAVANNIVKTLVGSVDSLKGDVTLSKEKATQGVKHISTMLGTIETVGSLLATSTNTDQVKQLLTLALRDSRRTQKVLKEIDTIQEPFDEAKFCEKIEKELNKTTGPDPPPEEQCCLYPLVVDKTVKVLLAVVPFLNSLRACEGSEMAVLILENIMEIAVRILDAQPQTKMSLMKVDVTLKEIMLALELINGSVLSRIKTFRGTSSTSDTKNSELTKKTANNSESSSMEVPLVTTTTQPPQNKTICKEGGTGCIIKINSLLILAQESLEKAEKSWKMNEDISVVPDFDANLFCSCTDDGSTRFKKKTCDGLPKTNVTILQPNGTISEPDDTNSGLNETANGTTTEMPTVLAAAKLLNSIRTVLIEKNYEVLRLNWENELLELLEKNVQAQNQYRFKRAYSARTFESIVINIDKSVTLFNRVNVAINGPREEKPQAVQTASVEIVSAFESFGTAVASWGPTDQVEPVPSSYEEYVEVCYKFPEEPKEENNSTSVCLLPMLKQSSLEAIYSVANFMKTVKILDAATNDYNDDIDFFTKTSVELINTGVRLLKSESAKKAFSFKVLEKVVTPIDRASSLAKAADSTIQATNFQTEKLPGAITKAKEDISKVLNELRAAEGAWAATDKDFDGEGSDLQCDSNPWPVTTTIRPGVSTTSIPDASKGTTGRPGGTTTDGAGGSESQETTTTAGGAHTTRGPEVTTGGQGRLTTTTERGGGSESEETTTTAGGSRTTSGPGPTTRPSKQRILSCIGINVFSLVADGLTKIYRITKRVSNNDPYFDAVKEHADEIYDNILTILSVKKKDASIRTGNRTITPLKSSNEYLSKVNIIQMARSSAIDERAQVKIQKLLKKAGKSSGTARKSWIIENDSENSATEVSEFCKTITPPTPGGTTVPPFVSPQCVEDLLKTRATEFYEVIRPFVKSLEEISNTKYSNEYNRTSTTCTTMMEVVEKIMASDRASRPFSVETVKKVLQKMDEASTYIVDASHELVSTKRLVLLETSDAKKKLKEVNNLITKSFLELKQAEKTWLSKRKEEGSSDSEFLDMCRETTERVLETTTVAASCDKIPVCLDEKLETVSKAFIDEVAELQRRMKKARIEVPPGGKSVLSFASEQGTKYIQKTMSFVKESNNRVSARTVKSILEQWNDSIRIMKRASQLMVAASKFEDSAEFSGSTGEDTLREAMDSLKVAWESLKDDDGTGSCLASDYESVCLPEPEVTTNKPGSDEVTTVEQECDPLPECVNEAIQELSEKLIKQVKRFKKIAKLTFLEIETAGAEGAKGFTSDHVTRYVRKTLNALKDKPKISVTAAKTILEHWRKASVEVDQATQLVKVADKFDAAADFSGEEADGDLGAAIEDCKVAFDSVKDDDGKGQCTTSDLEQLCYQTTTTPPGVELATTGVSIICEERPRCLDELFETVSGSLLNEVFTLKEKSKSRGIEEIKNVEKISSDVKQILDLLKENNRVSAKTAQYIIVHWKDALKSIRLHGAGKFETSEEFTLSEIESKLVDSEKSSEAALTILKDDTGHGPCRSKDFEKVCFNQTEVTTTTEDNSEETTDGSACTFVPECVIWKFKTVATDLLKQVRAFKKLRTAAGFLEQDLKGLEGKKGWTSNHVTRLVNKTLDLLIIDPKLPVPVADYVLRQWKYAGISITRGRQLMIFDERFGKVDFTGPEADENLGDAIEACRVALERVEKHDGSGSCLVEDFEKLCSNNETIIEFETTTEVAPTPPEKPTFEVIILVPTTLSKKHGVHTLVQVTATKVITAIFDFYTNFKEEFTSSVVKNYVVKIAENSLSIITSSKATFTVETAKKTIEHLTTAHTDIVKTYVILTQTKEFTKETYDNQLKQVLEKVVAGKESWSKNDRDDDDEEKYEELIISIRNQREETIKTKTHTFGGKVVEVRPPTFVETTIKSGTLKLISVVVKVMQTLNATFTVTAQKEDVIQIHKDLTQVITDSAKIITSERFKTPFSVQTTEKLVTAITKTSEQIVSIQEKISSSTSDTKTIITQTKEEISQKVKVVQDAVEKWEVIGKDQVGKVNEYTGVTKGVTTVNWNLTVVKSKVVTTTTQVLTLITTINEKLIADESTSESTKKVTTNIFENILTILVFPKQHVLVASARTTIEQLQKSIEWLTTATTLISQSGGSSEEDQEKITVETLLEKVDKAVLEAKERWTTEESITTESTDEDWEDLFIVGIKTVPVQPPECAVELWFTKSTDLINSTTPLLKSLHQTFTKDEYDFEYGNLMKVSSTILDLGYKLFTSETIQTGFTATTLKNVVNMVTEATHTVESAEATLNTITVQMALKSNAALKTFISKETKIVSSALTYLEQADLKWAIQKPQNSSEKDFDELCAHETPEETTEHPGCEDRPKCVDDAIVKLSTKLLEQVAAFKVLYTQASFIEQETENAEGARGWASYHISRYVKETLNILKEKPKITPKTTKLVLENWSHASTSLRHASQLMVAVEKFDSIGDFGGTEADEDLGDAIEACKNALEFVQDDDVPEACLSADFEAICQSHDNPELEDFQLVIYTPSTLKGSDVLIGIVKQIAAKVLLAIFNFYSTVKEGDISSKDLKAILVEATNHGLAILNTNKSMVSTSSAEPAVFSLISSYKYVTFASKLYQMGGNDNYTVLLKTATEDIGTAKEIWKVDESKEDAESKYQELINTIKGQPGVVAVTTSVARKVKTFHPPKSIKKAVTSVTAELVSLAAETLQFVKTTFTSPSFKGSNHDLYLINKRFTEVIDLGLTILTSDRMTKIFSAKTLENLLSSITKTTDKFKELYQKISSSSGDMSDYIKQTQNTVIAGLKELLPAVSAWAKIGKDTASVPQEYEKVAESFNRELPWIKLQVTISASQVFTLISNVAEKLSETRISTDTSSSNTFGILGNSLAILASKKQIVSVSSGKTSLHQLKSSYKSLTTLVHVLEGYKPDTEDDKIKNTIDTLLVKVSKAVVEAKEPWTDASEDATSTEDDWDEFIKTQEKQSKKNTSESGTHEIPKCIFDLLDAKGNDLITAVMAVLNSLQQTYSTVQYTDEYRKTMKSSSTMLDLGFKFVYSARLKHKFTPSSVQSFIAQTEIAVNTCEDAASSVDDVKQQLDNKSPTLSESISKSTKSVSKATKMVEQADEIWMDRTLKPALDKLTFAGMCPGANEEKATETTTERVVCYERPKCIDEQVQKLATKLKEKVDTFQVHAAKAEFSEVEEEDKDGADGWTSHHIARNLKKTLDQLKKKPMISAETAKLVMTKWSEAITSLTRASQLMFAADKFVKSSEFSGTVADENLGEAIEASNLAIDAVNEDDESVTCYQSDFDALCKGDFLKTEITTTTKPKIESSEEDEPTNVEEPIGDRVFKCSDLSKAGSDIVAAATALVVNAATVEEDEDAEADATIADHANKLLSTSTEINENIQNGKFTLDDASAITTEISEAIRTYESASESIQALETAGEAYVDDIKKPVEKAANTANQMLTRIQTAVISAIEKQGEQVLCEPSAQTGVLTLGGDSHSPADAPENSKSVSKKSGSNRALSGNSTPARKTSLQFARHSSNRANFYSGHFVTKGSLRTNLKGASENTTKIATNVSRIILKDYKVTCGDQLLENLSKLLTITNTVATKGTSMTLKNEWKASKLKNAVKTATNVVWTTLKLIRRVKEHQNGTLVKVKSTQLSIDVANEVVEASMLLLVLIDASSDFEHSSVTPVQLWLSKAHDVVSDAAEMWEQNYTEQSNSSLVLRNDSISKPTASVHSVSTHFKGEQCVCIVLSESSAKVIGSATALIRIVKSFGRSDEVLSQADIVAEEIVKNVTSIQSMLQKISKLSFGRANETLQEFVTILRSLETVKQAALCAVVVQSSLSNMNKNIHKIKQRGNRLFELWKSPDVEQTNGNFSFDLLCAQHDIKLTPELDREIDDAYAEGIHTINVTITLVTNNCSASIMAAVASHPLVTGIRWKIDNDDTQINSTSIVLLFRTPEASNANTSRNMSPHKDALKSSVVQLGNRTNSTNAKNGTKPLLKDASKVEDVHRNKLGYPLRLKLDMELDGVPNFQNRSGINTINMEQRLCPQKHLGVSVTAFETLTVVTLTLHPKYSNKSVSCQKRNKYIAICNLANSEHRTAKVPRVPKRLMATMLMHSPARKKDPEALENNSQELEDEKL